MKRLNSPSNMIFKIKGYYESEKPSGFINLTTRITTLYDHDRQPINYLLINVDKTENTIAYNKIQEFKNFFELVGDYAKVGYAHFDALKPQWLCLKQLV